MKKFDVLNRIASVGVVAVVRAENEAKATKNRPLGVGGELRKIALCECYRTGHRADCISYTDTNIFPRGFRTTEFVFEHRKYLLAYFHRRISLRYLITERRKRNDWSCTPLF